MAMPRSALRWGQSWWAGRLRIRWLGCEDCPAGSTVTVTPLTTCPVTAWSPRKLGSGPVVRGSAPAPTVDRASSRAAGLAVPGDGGEGRRLTSLEEARQRQGNRHELSWYRSSSYQE